MLRLVWRPKARRDLLDIAAFIRQRNPVAAQRLAALIRDAAERLPEHPYVHRPGRVPGTREAVVHPNYILIYRVLADTVEVITVLHARQKYP
ncbi:addiction module RelE/StbE family toxin [Sphingomonas sp. BE270]|jgi:toxin ParE1/3/4|uniref:type II toxin-antitoxin system RelE/ParE family toxin n=1 Tax=unclassified Sphingomonas TaxID=196159 RepID=UPI000B237338|nr:MULTISPECIES: type II toxin-antitoxin system RelE/ParE family toxin [unclassified Sphingomonas]MDR6848643.1 addiction module RelE/StbE family toxin [Sphingomonas sp. BE137]MDR7255925.1 addiction module RelE/StbE family toxin [Sphingomonas sp. BE270]